MKPLFYVDTSTVREGRHEELMSSMRRLAVFVEENVPRLISYRFFLAQDRRLMTVVAIHPDSESLKFHLEVGREEFSKFAELLVLQRIDVYGQLEDAVYDDLRRKAEMLGGGTVTAHEFFAGFTR